jgi:hypothetical protein
MKLLRCSLLLSVSAGVLMAQAATTRPATARAGVVLVAGTDLVVDSIFLRANGGATLELNGIRPTELYLYARVTNRGRERWASRGVVFFTLFAGRAGDGERPGVSIVRGPPAPGVAPGTDTLLYGPFRTQVSIGGSIGPGQSIRVAGDIRNSRAPNTMFVANDKFYTLVTSIRATGDVDERNNESRRVVRFRVGAHREFDALWEPLVTSGGTVRVNAPPRP